MSKQRRVRTGKGKEYFQTFIETSVTMIERFSFKN